MPTSDLATSPRPLRLARIALGGALALGLPCGLLSAMMPRHPADGFERLPGLLERPEYVERQGRFTVRRYERRGWGENGNDGFSVLELDGDPIRIPGGHLATAGLCPDCDGKRAPETALVYRRHRDPKLRGWYAVQVRGDVVDWTLLCEETSGPIDWVGTELALPCGVVFDATTGTAETPTGPSPSRDSAPPADADAPPASSSEARL